MLRYCAIDLETTGLDPERCQVIELAAVVETDWQCPVEELPFIRFLVSHDEIRGQPFALNMNARILEELAKPFESRTAMVVSESSAARLVQSLLVGHCGKPAWTLAGKNVATFDMRFLERLPGWDRTQFRHRVIDPGSMWMLPTDDRVPDTNECMRRAGVTNDHPHSALHDCYAVIEMVRARHLVAV